MTEEPEWQLKLFNCWRLERFGLPVEAPPRQQRVIAALALLGHRPRGFFAGLLWPAANEDHAAQSLRSCLWQITHRLPGLLMGSRNSLSLNPSIATDVGELHRRTAEIGASMSAATATGALRLLRSAELLPGWYEEWVLPEQESIRRIRLHSLEMLAEYYLQAGYYDEATEAAEIAALIDPFRESSQRLLIRSHLSAGNYAAALRSYTKFSAMLDREFGLRPSSDLADLLRRNANGHPGRNNTTRRHTSVPVRHGGRRH